MRRLIKVSEEIQNMGYELGEDVNETLDEAEKSCTGNYALCSSIEIHTGAYQVARNLGWLNWDTYFWTKSALNAREQYAQIKGLGICCHKLS